MGLFQEKVISLYLQRNTITGVLVTAFWRPFKPVYQSELLFRKDVSSSTSSYSDIWELLPLETPVILTIQSSVHTIFQPGFPSENELKTLKPLLDISGGYWQSNQSGETQIDTDLPDKLLTELKDRNIEVAGVVSLGAVIAGILKLDKTIDSIVILPEQQRFTYLAYQGNSLVHCRSIQVNSNQNQIEEHLANCIARGQLRQISWTPRQIVWTGPRSELELIPSSSTPVIDRQIDSSEIAETATKMYLARGKSTFLKFHGQSDYSFIKLPRKAMMLLKLSVITMLVATGVNLIVYDSVIRGHIREEESRIEKNQQIETSFSQLNTFDQLPDCKTAFRPHRHLPHLALAAGTNHVVLTELTVNMNVLRITGQGDNISSINSFTEQLRAYCTRNNLSLGDPETMRDLSGALVFKLAIDFRGNQ